MSLPTITCLHRIARITAEVTRVEGATEAVVMVEREAEQTRANHGRQHRAR